MITHCFLSFPSIYLCLLFISWPVDYSSFIDCIPFLISFYLHDPGTTCSILEYFVVLPIILLPSSAFFYLVILLTIGVYKLHSSPLPFSTLVYFVLLASIHLLLTPLDLFKSLSYFWVDTPLWTLEPSRQLCPSCYIETPQQPPVSLHRKNLWSHKVYTHPYLG